MVPILWSPNEALGSKPQTLLFANKSNSINSTHSRRTEANGKTIFSSSTETHMSVTSPTIFILYILLVCFHLPLCFTRDAITVQDSITDQHGATLISAGERFEFGFFGIISSPRRYMGIWYYRSNPKIIVWVANRNSPLSDVSGVFTITEDGNLKVRDRNNNLHWSTKLEGCDSFKGIVKLKDSGNLVLMKEDEQSGVIWQSFNEPTDTFLPGMKIEQNTMLISWKSSDNPESGNFTFQRGEEENQYIIRKENSTEYWKTGVSGKFINYDISPFISYMLSNFTGSSFNVNIFRKYHAISRKIAPSSVLDGNNIRLVMHFDGQVQIFIRNNESAPWDLTFSEPKDKCSVYKACGNFASCNSQRRLFCECLPGYKPVWQDSWDVGDFLQGCERTTTCSKDDKSRKFLSLNVTKVGRPDREFDVGGENDCIDDCMKDCNCPAYAYSETPQSRGRVGNRTCWIWSDVLNNIVEAATDTDAGREIHLRMQHMLTSNTKPGQDKPAYGRKTNWPLTVAAVTIAGVIILACSIVYISIQKKNAEIHGDGESNLALHLYDSQRHVKDLIDSGDFKAEDKQGLNLPFFDFESILAATDNFSEANKLGNGGFGPVYKGKFSGGQEIAVKRLSSFSGQGLEEFKNEVVLIARLQHRNLVRLLGYCIKGSEKILLYEYMPNKSLDFFIFDRTLSVMLDWDMRFNIILGIARGLLYLHQDSRLRIIHRDLKTSNVLLDEEMNPKISDFGLARIFAGKQTEGTTNRVVGTYGYMSPEYALDGFFSVKSDVFSFGVVVLEIISGKRNTRFYNSEETLNLIGYAWKLWQENKSLLDIMDKQLSTGASKTNEILKCINVALLCVQEDPNDRPTMSNVVIMLTSETENFPNPKRPAFVVRRGLSGSASSSSKPETNDELTISLAGR